MIEEIILLLPWLIPIFIWESFLKGFALWKSGRNKQPIWFVCIFLFNTLGILPILYLFLFQKNGNTEKLKNQSIKKTNTSLKKK